MAVTGAGTQCVKITAAGDTLSGRLNISYVRWVGGAVAGDVAVVADGSGSVFFASEADGANFLDIMPVYQVRDGLSVGSFSSGTLYVYLK